MPTLAFSWIFAPWRGTLWAPKVLTPASKARVATAWPQLVDWMHWHLLLSKIHIWSLINHGIVIRSHQTCYFPCTSGFASSQLGQEFSCASLIYSGISRCKSTALALRICLQWAVSLLVDGRSNEHLETCWNMRPSSPCEQLPTSSKQEATQTTADRGSSGHSTAIIPELKCSKNSSLWLYCKYNYIISTNIIPVLRHPFEQAWQSHSPLWARPHLSHRRSGWNWNLQRICGLLITGVLVWMDFNGFYSYYKIYLYVGWVEKLIRSAKCLYVSKSVQMGYTGPTCLR